MSNRGEPAPAPSASAERCLRYGSAITPLPNVQALLVWSATQELCTLYALQLHRDGEESAVLERCCRRFVTFVLQSAPASETQRLAARLFARFPLPPQGPLVLVGSDFQQRVWRQLQTLAPGQTHTYGELAEAIQRPQAWRAVANAVAANPLHWLIPCHRILPASGGLGGYRAGSHVKRLLLQAEGIDLN
ncbi:MAG: methylated-DNA--[protein]-cysteine S-methyltransferase [Desulfuromonadaceae bacterium]|nr:methylated-DNA--[protein]-cysteine S-methyltransferase [Desulfuromonadaceae bacterium]